jgi:hypothetical protein
MHGGTIKTHSSSANASESLYVGDVQIDKFDTFCEIFQKLLDAVKYRKVD